jgi:PAS domain S-box-containing protein
MFLLQETKMGKPLRVLMIEDSTEDADLILLNLRRSGYSVEYQRVQDRPGMLRALAENTWDIVLSDYTLPSFSGVAALQVYHEHNLDIPFIIISGAIGEDTAVEMMRAGAHDYVLKDRLTRLAPAIERELRESLTRQARKRAELALRASEERYRVIFDSAIDAIFVHELESGQLIEFNESACQMFGYTRDELLNPEFGLETIFTPPAPAISIFDFLHKAYQVGPQRTEWLMRHKNGAAIRTEIAIKSITLDGNTRIVSVVRDISQRKLVEDRLYTVINNIPVVLFSVDREGMFQVSEGKGLELLGLKPGEVVGRSSYDVYKEYPDIIEGLKASLQGKSTSNLAHIADAYFETLFAPLCSPDGEITGVIGVASDVTGRIHAEQDLRASEDRFRSVVQNLSDIITLHSTDGSIIYESPSVTRVLGYGKGYLASKKPFDFIHPDDLPAVKHALKEAASGRKSDIPTEFRFRKADGSFIYLESNGKNLLEHPGINAILITSHDITERKRAEEQLRWLNRALRATSDCNQALVRAVDEFSLLEEICQIVVDIGGYVFAWIGYIDDDDPEKLVQPVARFGYEAGYLDEISVSLKNPDYKGSPMATAIYTLQPAIINDVQSDPRAGGFRDKAAQRNYQAVIALPITLEGQVFGGLAIYADRPDAFDADEVVLLKEMAEDLSYGIHTLRVRMAHRTAQQMLEISNTELARAYDATLEGWSHALELRERETAGHSQRVVDLTLNLANIIGIDSSQLIHIRRGALLHDIGKMGIPDSILLKPGPLTEDEWVVMRQHPNYAYQLLTDIPYLQPALDIPYSHHERWDGSGYPRGLSGADIPLAARIFAIVDVWDALSSDRPYRPAWPRDSVLAYVKEKSGIHFDPEIVKIFLDVFQEKGTS